MDVILTRRPIVGFTGANGSGKTLLAVSEAISDMKRGRPVVSTVPIRHVDPRTGAVYEAEPLRSYEQLLGLRECTLLLDEAAGVFASRDTMALPTEVVLWLHSLRHRDVTVRWTAPGWGRVDVNLRLVTKALVTTRGVIERGSVDWPDPALIFATVWDTTDVAPDAVPKSIMKRHVVRTRGALGLGAYDTLADTPRLGHPALTGNCPDCGGRRKPEYCTPERHQLLGIGLRSETAESEEEAA